MGKKKRQISQASYQAGIYIVVLIAIALLYQNCSEIRLDGGRSYSPSTQSIPSAPVADSPDAYNYKSTDSSSRPDGGTEPGDWAVEGAYWFDNFIFGNPGFNSCEVFNIETQSVEKKSLLVITGEEKEVTVGKKTQLVKSQFELVNNALDMRFGEMGTGGITAFRIYVPPTTNTSSGKIDSHICCGNNAMPQGVVITISRKLCDFREKNAYEKIYTQDYCTIGNTVNSGVDIMTSFEIANSPSGKQACSLQPGYYYYVNIITGHFNFEHSSYLNGVFNIRP